MLESRGWSWQRINGSRHIYGKAGSQTRPVYGNQSLKVGLQRHLMKLAGLRFRNTIAYPTTACWRARLGSEP